MLENLAGEWMEAAEGSTSKSCGRSSSCGRGVGWCFAWQAVDDVGVADVVDNSIQCFASRRSGRHGNTNSRFL